MELIRLHVAWVPAHIQLEHLSNITPHQAGQHRATEALTSYHLVGLRGYEQGITNQRQRGNYKNIYGAHVVTSLVKRLIGGTYKWRLEPKYLKSYLNEYAFRFNRKKSKRVGKIFMRLVHQVVRSSKIICDDIK